MVSLDKSVAAPVESSQDDEVVESQSDEDKKKIMANLAETPSQDDVNKNFPKGFDMLYANGEMLGIWGNNMINLGLISADEVNAMKERQRKFGNTTQTI